MGLFSGLKGKGASPNLDTSTALMIPIVSAMVADGQIEDDEILQIRSICAWSPIFKSNSRDQDTEIVLKALRLIEDEGADAMCAKAADILSEGLRETAFCFAARMLFADGHVGRKEMEWMEAVVGRLKIKADRAKMIVEVVSIMQHDATS